MNVNVCRNGLSSEPNENYAREVLQLFSIGTFLLKQDGTRQVDSSGSNIPTYDQAAVTEFARVFTGWVFAPALPGPATPGPLPCRTIAIRWSSIMTARTARTGMIANPRRYLTARCCRPA